MAPYFPAVPDLPPPNILLLLAVRWEGCGEQEDYIVRGKNHALEGREV